MLTKAVQKLFFISAILVIFTLASCQKDTNPNDPDPIPDGVKDSTLLIKSIAYLFDNGMNGQDSIVEHYSYDSVNRKITLTWDDASDNYVVDGTSAEFAYNNKGLLSRVVYKYPADYTPADYDYKTVGILYDAENILQKITTELGDGNIESLQFNKTMLPSGNYQLSWEETDPALPDETFPRKIIFNADGKSIIVILEHLFKPAGENFYANVIIKDSLAYDATGNVSKVFTNISDTLNQYNESYTSFDFLTRQTKGDQLYNQRKVIMNGIANIPFDYSDLGSFIADEAVGILSITLSNEYLQYSKYPIQQAKVRMWDGSFRDFTANSEFDNTNRLTKFKGFFRDYDLELIEYKISYYK